MSNQYSSEYYMYTVAWSEREEVFLGKVAEFPTLLARGESIQKAMNSIQKAVELQLKELQQSGQEIPKPLGMRTFSGKVNLRMARSMHRALTIEAAKDNVSLNQFINNILSESLKSSLYINSQP